MKREDIEKMVRSFVKRGDFETAAGFAEEFGDINLAIEYMQMSKKFKNKNKREIFYQGPSPNKDLVKDIIYLNTSRPRENSQNFPYKDYHFLSEHEINLKKN